MSTDTMSDIENLLENDKQLETLKRFLEQDFENLTQIISTQDNLILGLYLSAGYEKLIKQEQNLLDWQTLKNTVSNNSPSREYNAFTYVKPEDSIKSVVESGQIRSIRLCTSGIPSIIYLRNGEEHQLERLVTEEKEKTIHVFHKPTTLIEGDWRIMISRYNSPYDAELLVAKTVLEYSIKKD